jgi:hypothetical protein
MTYREFQEKAKGQKQELLDRMGRSYQKNKRKDKIDKLKFNPNHWKGLI